MEYPRVRFQTPTARDRARPSFTSRRSSLTSISWQFRRCARNFKALEKVRKILGRDNWDYVVTDVTEGSPGNRERLAFLYDKRKVRFAGVAGELLIPPKEIKAKGKKTVYEAVQINFTVRLLWSASRRGGSSSC